MRHDPDYVSRRMLFARIDELQEEIRALKTAAPQPAEPRLGWKYFHQCSKCSKESVIDISPSRLAENHTMQLAEDEHRAWLHMLASPEAERMREIQAAEMREAAEEKARRAERDARVEAVQDQHDVMIKFADGPWGSPR